MTKGRPKVAILSIEEHEGPLEGVSLIADHSSNIDCGHVQETIGLGAIGLALTGLLAALYFAAGRTGMCPVTVSPTMIHGQVAPGFEGVEAEFRKNFAERGECGATVTVYYRGSKVVDLWGGYRDPKSEAQWDEDTMEIVFSTTKGMSAIVLAMLNSRGYLDYDERMATYWPEFAQNGKGNITVRQLISHQAGLAALDEPLDYSTLADLDKMAQILARQRPEWEPGTRSGYHAVTLGFYENELVRRTDPQHRSIGRFFAEEVAVPLGIEFYIGLPKDVPLSRIGTLEVNSNKLAWVVGTVKENPKALRMVLAFMNPGSLTSRVLNSPLMVQGADFANPACRGVEFAAHGGIGQARAIARAYSALAVGGGELGITPKTMAALKAPAVAPTGGERDLVLGMELKHSLGFGKPTANLKFGSSDSAFGWPGAGGSFGFADPDAQIGFGYVMNRMGTSFTADARAMSLMDAVYRSIAKR
ncbi:MAG TPA: serine hydrolase domain-containing protein [Nitrospiraceae bacterium]|nr:serine hydrolase domain-containing protein [Nitrospiraceae bacterium]